MGGVTPRDQTVSHAPTAVIFDWDNTLVDSWATIHEALAGTFEHFGLPAWSMDEVKAQVRQSLRDSFPRYFGDQWEAARDIYLGRFEAIHLTRCVALPGAAALLDGLTTRWRIPAGIVSNKTGRLLRKEVDYLGWSAHFVSVVGAGDAISDKPNPAPVDLIRKELSTQQSQNIWFIGDTDIDMACAHNAKCRAVLVGDETKDVTVSGQLSQLNGWALDYQFSDLFALTDHLAKLNQTE
ncbi:MAG: HAD family hydrolase [Pseudomonadota bacterium]